MSQFTKQYQDFFRDSEAGQNVLKELDSIITAEHMNAERTDDMQVSYSHTQRAKGARLALDKIKGLTMEVKKPR